MRSTWRNCHSISTWRDRSKEAARIAAGLVAVVILGTLAVCAIAEDDRAPERCACRAACRACTSSRPTASGQRTFYYWRDSSPARQLFELPQTPALAAALAEYDVIYLSGVTLSLYGEAGPQAAVRGARPRPGRRAPHRLRHQFPHPRLAGSGAGQGRLPRGHRPRRHRARLHGRPRLAVRPGGRGRVAGRRPARRGRAQARRARRSHLPCRQAADRCCRAGRRTRSTRRPRATALRPPIWRHAWPVPSRPRPPSRGTGWRERSCATAARSFRARRCRRGRCRPLGLPRRGAA